MRRLLFALFLLASAPAFAAGTFSSLPDATEPLGGTTEYAPLDQGSGCSTSSVPCSTVKAPPVRFGQPVQTTCSSVSSPFLYQECIDTSLSPPVDKIWLGSQWVPKFVYNTTAQTVALSGARTILTGTTTFYVNTSLSSSPCGGFTCSPGNDANNGLSPSTPWKTLQHSVSAMANGYDFASQLVNLQMADATYNECLLLPAYVASSANGRNVSILGDASNPGLTIVNCSSPPSATITAVNNPQGWILKNIKVTGSSTCVFVDYHSAIYWDGGDFGNCGIDVQAVNVGAFFEFINNNYTIDGNTQVHVGASDGGEIIWQAVTGVVTTPITVSVAFAEVSTGGIVDAQFASFSGSVTGTKFVIGTTPPSDNSGVLYCGNGADCNSKLPGSVLGNFASPTFNNASMNALLLYNNSRSGVVTLTSDPGSTYSQQLPAGAGLSNQFMSGSTTMNWSNAARPIQFSTGKTPIVGTTAAQWMGQGALDSSNTVSLLVPAASTLQNFYAGIGTAPGGGITLTYTLMVNGSPSTVTCQISGASATACNDTTHSTAVNAGDAIDVQIVSSSNSVATSSARAAVQSN